MKAHIVMKQYSNGAAAVQRVFSSRKRALDWVVNFYAHPCWKDGWDVYMFQDAVYGESYRLTLPSMNENQIEVIYVVSEEIV